MRKLNSQPLIRSKKSTVIIINGMARSGKDTVTSAICNWGLGKIPIHKWSTIQMPKATLAEYAKREYDPNMESDRLFLSKFKALINEHFNYTNISFQRMLPFNGHVLLVHSREPEEIEEFRRICLDNGIRFITLLVTRSDIKKIESNDSDKNCENMFYDYIIENDGSLYELERKAERFCERVFQG